MCDSQTDQNPAQILVFFEHLFYVLSGIWCKFDVMCLFFLLQGHAPLLGHALV